MSKRVLIVNRGEIAIRVAKALNELNFVSVGLWTDSEPQAAHLEFCREWIHLKGQTNRETYLNIDQIIEICREHKIDAVHPGYGFLSENAEFAERCEKEKVIFIGPNPKAIRLMGDKATSKTIAKNAGVPVVPGSTGEVKTVEAALEIAAQIKYPILLKAVAGGGGKGMRVCNSEEEVRKNFESVQREALSSFNNQALLVEKYITNPHHIEIQVLADKTGNIFHLFERECSIQRRHQKIIEEAPSPFIGKDEALRLSIAQTAMTLARAVGYDSAGTVEFIMGEDKSFYFLEMNTRIQVEHPITEEITNIDLVANMIKAAFHMPLDFERQEDIKISGHAIELRICAEDPKTMLPAPGLIDSFESTFPQGIRFDHCLYPGFNITSDFDPMIGKLIARGINRSTALRKMRAALKSLSVEGLKTNIPLLMVILDEENFEKGQYSTHYIQKIKPESQVPVSLAEGEIFEKIALVDMIQSGVSL